MIFFLNDFINNKTNKLNFNIYYFNMNDLFIKFENNTPLNYIANII